MLLALALYQGTMLGSGLYLVQGDELRIGSRIMAWRRDKNQCETAENHVKRKVLERSAVGALMLKI